MNTSNRAHIALPQVLEDTAGLAKIADLPRTGLDSVLRVAAQNIGLKEVHARLAVAVAASRECCTPGVDTGARAQVGLSKYWRKILGASASTRHTLRNSNHQNYIAQDVGSL